jgi:hypothetical protein
MKNFDFVKIGSACFDSITIHCSVDSVGLVVDDNDKALEAIPNRENISKLKLELQASGKTIVDVLKEYEVRGISILKIHLGQNSCKALLDLFKYLKEEASDVEYRPSQIYFEYSANSETIDYFFTALKEAISLDYTVDGQDGDSMVLNYSSY